MAVSWSDADFEYTLVKLYPIGGNIKSDYSERHRFPDVRQSLSHRRMTFNGMRMIWLAMGSNRDGAQGSGTVTICHAVRLLSHHKFAIVAHSGCFLTPAMGHGRQAAYLNAVVGIRGSIGPAALLRLVKRIERDAGRRTGVRWGPRPLDIDILDHGGRILGHPATATRRGSLILPHPGIASRGFVLVPLAEAGPAWRHPLLGLGANALLARRPRLRHGIIRLDSSAFDECCKGDPT